MDTPDAGEYPSVHPFLCTIRLYPSFDVSVHPVLVHDAQAAASAIIVSMMLFFMVVIFVYAKLQFFEEITASDVINEIEYVKNLMFRM